MPEPIITLNGPEKAQHQEKSQLQIDIHELMGNPPGWLMHSGISIVFVFVMLLGLLSWFIKYPDKMEAPVLIESKNPPVEIISAGFSVIDSILIKDGQSVNEGQVLAILKNPGLYKDILVLENWLAMINVNAKLNSRSVIPAIASNLQLGDLQNNYAGLLQVIDEFSYFQKLGDTQEQITALEREIDRIKALNQTSMQQQDIFEREIQLKQKELSRTQELRLIGASSEEELEREESEWLQMQRQEKQLQSGLIQNQIRIEQLNAQQQQLKHDKKNGINNRIFTIHQEVKQIEAALEKWKETYLITAPISGKVSFATTVAEKQPIRGQELVFTILPQIENNPIIARCQVPVQGIGKLSVGTSVLIYLDAYPYKEFGILETRVSDMAVIPQKNKEDALQYQIAAALPDTLTTSYREVIPFRQKLSGQAVLISEDKRILERIFQQMVSLLRN